MKTLSEMIHGNPEKLLSLAKSDPGLTDNILVGHFSAQFIDAEGKKVSLKKHWFMFTRFFHLNMRSQVDCFLIEKYQAKQIIKVTIHDDKSRTIQQRLKEIY
jgi:hypothetical protein